MAGYGGDGGGSGSGSPTSSNGLDLALVQARRCLIIEFCQELTRGSTYTSLAESIRKARKAKGISQKDLAVLVGVNPKTVARWEYGRVPHARHM